MAKSILFRADANATIGWGHFYRSLALAHMLRSEFDIAFAVADPLPGIKKILHHERFELITLPALNYTSPDSRGTREFDCDLHGLLDNTDIVVTDGYWFQEKYRDGLRKEEKVKIAVIEDDGGGDYDADLIINHAPGLSQSNYITLPNTQFALGLEYALLRPEFLKAAREPAVLETNNNTVFICFGGADQNGLSVKAAQEVLKHTTHQVNLIISPNHERISQANKLSSIYPKRISIFANLNAEEMVAAMTAATFGIVPSSGILYECLACRLPVISGYFAENQKQIYSGFNHLHAFVDAKDFNTSSWESLFEEVENHNSKNIIDGESASRYINEFHLISSK